MITFFTPLAFLDSETVFLKSFFSTLQAHLFVLTALNFVTVLPLTLIFNQTITFCFSPLVMGFSFFFHHNSM